MLTKTLIGSIIALSLLSQTGCVGMGKESADKVANSDPATLGIGQPWRLTALAGESIQTSPEITLQFSREGRLSGNGGCNRYFGIFNVSPHGELTIGQIGATKMFCPDNMELETRYLKSLAGVTGFSVVADQLKLIGYDGALEFISQ